MLCGAFIGSSPFFSVSTQLLYVPEYKMRTLFIIWNTGDHLITMHKVKHILYTLIPENLVQVNMALIHLLVPTWYTILI